MEHARTPTLRLIGGRGETADDHAVARVRGGDTAAFGEIVARYASPLRRFVRGRMCQAGATATEDIVQEVFIATYFRLMSTERRMDMRAWLYRCAANACVDELRRSRPLPLPDEHACHRQADVLTDRRWSVDELVAGVRDLPQRQGQALVMHVLDDRSYGEIAETFDLSTSAVKSLIHRARRQLRARAALQQAG